MLNLNTGNIENSNFFIEITKPSEVSPPSGAYQALRYVSYKSIEYGELLILELIHICMRER